jgi:hypothetical protein
MHAPIARIAFLDVSKDEELNARQISSQYPAI